MHVFKYLFILTIAGSAVPAWAAEGDTPPKSAQDADDDSPDVKSKFTFETEWPVPVELCVSTPPDTCP